MKDKTPTKTELTEENQELKMRLKALESKLQDVINSKAKLFDDACRCKDYKSTRDLPWTG